MTEESVSIARQKPCFYNLECSVMPYDWGQSGESAFIHELMRARGQSVDASQPAAELWMGAHPKAPAALPDGRPLDEAIRQDREHFLGPNLTDRGYTRLPFLFKVLDAARPLSIQAHPDRDLAPELHARDPKNYPDDNHKPELAVCLADMSALIGFRPPEEILRFLKTIPELRALCTPAGSIYEEEDETGLSAPQQRDETARRTFVEGLYGQLMQSSPVEIEEAVQAHRLRLSMLEDEAAPREDALFLRLAELYGDKDSGVFSVYFLNYVDMAPEEALFLGPNEPHAYLGGRILECMAASDNVVRAGLTAKYMDTDTLLRMLHYRSGHPEIRRPQQIQGDSRMSSYKVEAEDFRVYKLQTGPTPLKLSVTDRPGIVLALEQELSVEARDAAGNSLGSANFPRGSAVLFPGDLSERGCQILLHSSHDARAYLATVGPNF
ncbi:MAG: mannose-6-phosphate isomerase, class I [bacterium]|nr:mannose-6-phosphate isomerase, class I [bacterium]